MVNSSLSISPKCRGALDHHIILELCFSVNGQERRPQGMSEQIRKRHTWHQLDVYSGARWISTGHCLGAPNPYNLSKKYWQYTSNLYRNTTPICNAVPCWLLSFGERETLQYTSNLYCNTPPICTYLYCNTPPICTGDTLEKTPMVGSSGKFLVNCRSLFTGAFEKGL